MLLRYPFHRVEQLLPHSGIGDLVIEADQLDACWILRVVTGLVLAGFCREKIGERRPQDCGDFPQPRGADPVGAALVFLHLLKGQAKLSAELLLTHVEIDAPGADSAADMDIDRVRHASAAAECRRRGPFGWFAHGGSCSALHRTSSASERHGAIFARVNFPARYSAAPTASGWRRARRSASSRVSFCNSRRAPRSSTSRCARSKVTVRRNAAPTIDLTAEPISRAVASL